MSSNEDSIDREVWLESHPVISTAYILITPMIAKVYSILRERVFSRHTGTFLYATPRKGKTKCATTITDLLTIEFPNKYILYHSADGHKSANLVRDLIAGLGLSGGSKDHSDLLERFVVHVRIQVESLGGSHFVLIIDENQLLSTDSWADLLVIHNRLEGNGVSMTTLGFGQEQILQKIEFLFKVKATNLVARFLCEPIRFDGCVTEADLESILYEYDVNKEFPIDSGCTYTEFFLPKAFAANFRMTSCNKKIWSELVNIAGEDGPGILPLEHIFRVIERILIRCRHMDCSEFKVTEGIVKEAVAASLIAEFVAMIRQSVKNDI